MRRVGILQHYLYFEKITQVIYISSPCFILRNRMNTYVFPLYSIPLRLQELRHNSNVLEGKEQNNSSHLKRMEIIVGHSVFLIFESVSMLS